MPLQTQCDGIVERMNRNIEEYLGTDLITILEV